MKSGNTNEMSNYNHKLYNAGRLAFPLYHATSNIFYHSIIEHGLGGKNPIAEFKVLITLQQLLAYEAKKPIIKSNWPLRQHLLERMANQEKTSGGYNFMHGQVYLTPSKHTAKNYGMQKYGSELISETLNLYQDLGMPKEFKTTDHPVLTLLDQKSNPIFVTIPSMPIEFLCDEMANSAQEAIDKWMEAFDSDSEVALSTADLVNELAGDPINFRLLRPIKIEAEQITIHLE